MYAFLIWVSLGVATVGLLHVSKTLVRLLAGETREIQRQVPSDLPASDASAGFGTAARATGTQAWPAPVAR